jgi:hypothetical protein
MCIVRRTRSFYNPFTCYRIKYSRTLHYYLKKIRVIYKYQHHTYRLSKIVFSLGRARFPMMSLDISILINPASCKMAPMWSQSLTEKNISNLL